MLCQALVAALADPAVPRKGSQRFEALDFSAVTLAVLTLSLAPLACETIEFNALVRNAKNSLHIALGRCAADMMDEEESCDYWVLKESYTASSDVSAFDFAQDVAGELSGFANRAGAQKAARWRFFKKRRRPVFLQGAFFECGNISDTALWSLDRSSSKRGKYVSGKSGS